MGKLTPEKMDTLDKWVEKEMKKRPDVEPSSLAADATMAGVLGTDAVSYMDIVWAKRRLNGTAGNKGGPRTATAYKPVKTKKNKKTGVTEVLVTNLDEASEEDEIDRMCRIISEVKQLSPEGRNYIVGRLETIGEAL